MEHLSVSSDGLGHAAVTADRNMLERVILNILENSRKYRSGETAHITISSDTNEDGDVEVRFEDDGPGVPEDKLPKLFEAFYRADPARKNPSGGSGLGLAIVRNAMEHMNGSVRAENAAGGGLAVIITLPPTEGDAK
jgi:signal transduction histidine kinase